MKDEKYQKERNIKRQQYAPGVCGGSKCLSWSVREKIGTCKGLRDSWLVTLDWWWVHRRGNRQVSWAPKFFVYFSYPSPPLFFSLSFFLAPSLVYWFIFVTVFLCLFLFACFLFWFWYFILNLYVDFFIVIPLASIAFLLDTSNNFNLQKFGSSDAVQDFQYYQHFIRS